MALPNSDGTFDIYINSTLCPARQHEALEHELRHIMHDHFYNNRPVADCEQEADTRRAG